MYINKLPKKYVLIKKLKETIKFFFFETIKFLKNSIFTFF